MDKKRSAVIRNGDMRRVAWKVPGKAAGKCLDAEGCWASTPGISERNVSREARKHARETGHTTRVAYLEVVEYRPELVAQPVRAADS
jgi:hypothetical protein